MARDYKSELKEAEAELGNLLAGFELMQSQIAKQKRVVAALTELANVEEESSVPVGLVSGVTDAVRTVFMGAEKPLIPAEVRSRVEALGLPHQQNLLASVHTVIRRLLDSGEIEIAGDASFADGDHLTTPAYKWKRKEQNTITIGDVIVKIAQARAAMEKSVQDAVHKQRAAEEAVRIEAVHHAQGLIDAAKLQEPLPADAMSPRPKRRIRKI
jgi:hypothetical protein